MKTYPRPPLYASALLGAAALAASAAAGATGFYAQARYDPGLRNAPPVVSFELGCEANVRATALDPEGPAEYCPGASGGTVDVWAHDAARIGAEPLQVEEFVIEVDPGECADGGAPLWVVTATIDESAAAGVTARIEREPGCLSD